jgi:hypothetical protein
VSDKMSDGIYGIHASGLDILHGQKAKSQRHTERTHTIAWEHHTIVISSSSLCSWRDYPAIVWMGLGQLTTFQNQRASSHSASIPVGVSKNCMFHAHNVIQTIVGTPSVAVRVAGVIIKVRHG